MKFRLQLFSFTLGETRFSLFEIGKVEAPYIKTFAISKGASTPIGKNRRDRTIGFKPYSEEE